MAWREVQASFLMFFRSSKQKTFATRGPTRCLPLHHLFHHQKMIMFLSKVIVTAAFVLLFALAPVLGQVADTIPRMQVAKWEVGVDLLGLFNENNLPKKSIFFRRNYAISNQKCKALRLRIGLDTEIGDGYAFDGLLLGEYQSYAPYLRLGHEWRFISGRYAWFTGFDVTGRYEHTNRYRLVGDNQLFTDEKIRDYDIGFSWIIGGSLKFSKRLDISIESSLDALYIRRKYDAVDIRDNVVVAYGSENRKRLTTNIQPLLSINVNYSIQKFHKK
jgi:hypothetical protein